MIPVDADFKRYKVIVAPVLYMVKEGMKEALETFVENGGILFITYMSGIVDQSDNVHLGGYPGPLKKLAGIWVEEIDALAPEQFNRICFEDGKNYTCNLVCERIHLEGAEQLGTYEMDFYAKEPAVTKNSFGKGHVYYLGSQIQKEGKEYLLDRVCNEAGVHSIVENHTGLEIICRRKEDKKIYFILNFHENSEKIPKEFYGYRDLLTGDEITEDMILEQYGVCIVHV